MQFLPTQINQKLAERFKESSIKVHNANLKRVYKLLTGKKTPKFDASKLLEVNKVKQELNGIKLSSRKNVVNSIIRVCENYPLLKAVQKKYEKYFKTLAEQHNHDYQYKAPTSKEEKNKIEWERVIEMRDEKDVEFERMIKAAARNPEKYDHTVAIARLLLNLYTRMPPLRGGEYLNMKILELSDSDDATLVCEQTAVNVCDILDNTLHICNHKTVAKYGIKVVQVSDQLIAVIREVTDLFGEYVQDYDDWLLPHFVAGRPFTNVELTKIFKRIFAPYNISTQMLRKMYIGHFLSQNPSVEDRKELTRIMGHSLEMQEFVYSRFRRGAH
jgi:integrase